MGSPKEDYEEMMATGMNLAGADSYYVCANCFEDDSLKLVVQQNAIENSCDFCHAEAAEEIAASLSDIVRHIDASLRGVFNVAENRLMYCGREGGYQGRTWDTRELVRHELQLELPNDDSGRLFNMICDALGHRAWCDDSPGSLTDDERLLYSWNSFCKFIQHRRRFFFLSPGKPAPADDYEQLLNPEEILAEIARLCKRFGLVRILERGTPLVRARWQAPGSQLTGPLDLGPPPEHLAVQPNRMSPPGIPLLYACSNERTALRETATSPGAYVVGVFALERDARVLDLSQVPPVPSPFDIKRKDERGPVLFLHEFVRHVSMPLKRDDRLQLEYVPTQVVTEYFREYYRDEGGGLDGIVYPSSRGNGEICYALFASQHELVVDECDVAAGEWRERESVGWIRLVTQHVRRVTAKDLASK